VAAGIVHPLETRRVELLGSPATRAGRIWPPPAALNRHKSFSLFWLRQSSSLRGSWV